jgi:hypothetical protein
MAISYKGSVLKIYTSKSMEKSRRIDGSMVSDNDRLPDIYLNPLHESMFVDVSTTVPGLAMIDMIRDGDPIIVDGSTYPEPKPVTGSRSANSMMDASIRFFLRESMGDLRGIRNADKLIGDSPLKFLRGTYAIPGWLVDKWTGLKKANPTKTVKIPYQVKFGYGIDEPQSTQKRSTDDIFTAYVDLYIQ